MLTPVGSRKRAKGWSRKEQEWWRTEESGIEAKYRFEKEKRITYESAPHPLFILSSVDQPRAVPFILFFHLAWENDYGSFRPKRPPLILPTTRVRSSPLSLSTLPPTLVSSLLFLSSLRPSNVSIRSRRAFGPRGLLICLPIRTISLRVAHERATIPRIQERARCHAVAPSNLFFESLACSVRFVLGEAAFVGACCLSLPFPRASCSGRQRPTTYSSLSLTTGHLHRGSMGLPGCLNNPGRELHDRPMSIPSTRHLRLPSALVLAWFRDHHQHAGSFYCPPFSPLPSFPSSRSTRKNILCPTRSLFRCIIISNMWRVFCLTGQLSFGRRSLDASLPWLPASNNKVKAFRGRRTICAEEVIALIKPSMKLLHFAKTYKKQTYKKRTYKK